MNKDGRLMPHLDKAKKNQLLKKRNYFMSYHHSSDYIYLQKLREKFENKKFADYGFKEEDLGESSKMLISKKIQYRLWSSSVTIVLVGEMTGESAWIDWEIWYSLQNFRDSKVPRRRYKPKGLLALYLPIDKHNVPERLQSNIDSGYARELHWDEIDNLFDEKVSEAYNNRLKLNLIKNDIPLKDDPRKIFGKLSLKKLFSL